MLIDNGIELVEQRQEANQSSSSPPEDKSAHTNGQPATPQPATTQDGGLFAWLQVFGVFFCWFNSWGLTNAFGVFQTYYQDNLLHSSTPSQISWIGSFQSFLLIAVGVLSGPAYDAGFFKPLLWCGSFLVVFGYFMTSLCKEYWQVMLAQGLVIGVGTGCLFVPSVSILPQYFVKRRALANGIAASGSSFGGVIYPIIVHRLIPRIGFGWTVRVVAFIALATQAVPILVLKVKVQAPKRRLLFDVKAFKEPPFFLFTLALFLALMALYIPTFYVQSFALTKGLTSPELAAYILPILNSAGVVGRVLPNFFADKTGPLNLLTPCIAATAILAFAWISVTNEGGLIAFALVYGFFSGTILSLPPVAVVSLCPNLGVVATRLGTSFALASLGLLIGTPISGAILSDTQQFTGLQAFAGAILLASAGLLLVARLSRTGFVFSVKA
ncbi:MAG: hypothetical protein M1828_001436 [Chrysothrix sp. TS-e1954]|nr:MAG: hypothetical protein M1828_001436 [Chrysothrix sp. TS-e1954]